MLRFDATRFQEQIEQCYANHCYPWRRLPGPWTVQHHQSGPRARL